MSNQPERDEQGRFRKGVSGNPKGRLPRQREEKYYHILMDAVSFDDWAVIVRKAAEQAKRGDAKAREWLGSYLVGQPEQDHNIEGEAKIIIEYRRAPDSSS